MLTEEMMEEQPLLWKDQQEVRAYALLLLKLVRESVDEKTISKAGASVSKIIQMINYEKKTAEILQIVHRELLRLGK